jgi:hypothetical protein
LLKGPFAPGGARGVGANGTNEQTSVEEKAVPAASWPNDPPRQARAAAASDAPVTLGVASNFSSSATATMVAEERRDTKPSPRDGNWTRSTFDSLIDALKHGRAVARE